MNDTNKPNSIGFSEENALSDRESPGSWPDLITWKGWMRKGYKGIYYLGDNKKRRNVAKEEIPERGSEDYAGLMVVEEDA